MISLFDLPSEALAKLFLLPPSNYELPGHTKQVWVIVQIKHDQEILQIN